MADVFISYSKEDRERARDVAALLINAGFRVFWDRDVPVGTLTSVYIADRLAEAAAVVVLWSEAALRSSWVNDEASIGRGRGILAPARISNCSPPLGYGDTQYADLSNWDGKNAGHDEWRRLEKRVRELVGGPPPPPPPPPPPGGMIAIPAGSCLRGFSAVQIEAVVAYTTDVYQEIVPDSVRSAMEGEPVSEDIVRAFLIGEAPVTNREFNEFLSATGHRTTWQLEGGSICTDEALADHPATHVTHGDAQAYCASKGGALPSFEQWVRAFRGDDRRLYPWGDVFDAQKCDSRESFQSNEVKTTPVRRYSAGRSPFGCFDLVGNVSEWTSTARGKGTYYATVGGGYSDPCAVLGLPLMLAFAPAQLHQENLGFRLVLPAR